MSIVDDLISLFTDTLGYRQGTLNEFGDFTPSGALVNVPCRIEGEQRLVRDPSGQELTASVIVLVAGYYGLTTDLHRYYLPTRFTPNGSEGAGPGLRAVYVDKVSDETDLTLMEEIGLP